MMDDERVKKYTNALKQARAMKKTMNTITVLAFPAFILSSLFSLSATSGVGFFLPVFFLALTAVGIYGSFLYGKQIKDFKRYLNPVDVPRMKKSKPTIKSLKESSKSYLKLIREANDRIPGLEVSVDIYDIENLTSRIFEYVIEDASRYEDLKTFFEYYLPTTLKLINTYVNLEEQSMQTSQIRRTKNEIKAMIKNTKKAFAKLYDKILGVKALDISAEISTMESMMASQGLINEYEELLKQAILNNAE